jgi:hypothetical protein
MNLLSGLRTSEVEIFPSKVGIIKGINSIIKGARRMFYWVQSISRVAG